MERYLQPKQFLQVVRSFVGSTYWRDLGGFYEPLEGSVQGCWVFGVRVYYCGCPHMWGAFICCASAVALFAMLTTVSFAHLIDKA